MGKSNISNERQQELINAIKAIDSTWCPPGDVRFLELVVPVRGRKLSGLIQQAVRLVRLAEAAGGRRGYVDFFYRQVKLLRTAQFAAAVNQAAQQGHLSGIVQEVPAGVVFVEPQMNGTQGRYELKYGQMPRIVGFLEIVHTALGFDEVRRILGGILEAPMRTTAAEAALELRRAFSTWLNPRAENDQALRQARAIRAFIAATGRQDRSDPYDNEMILSFWEKVGSVPGSPDGLREFRFAVKNVLRYRMVEMERSLARAESNAADLTGGDYGAGTDYRGRSDVAGEFESFGFGDAVIGGYMDLPPDQQELTGDAPTEISWLTAEADDEGTTRLRSSLDIGSWEPPVRELTEGPAGRIKWIRDKTSWRQLGTLVPIGTDTHGANEEEQEVDFDDGGGEEAGAGAEGAIDPDERESRAAGPIFTHTPPQRHLFLTFARYAYFGGVQQAITKTRGSKVISIPSHDGYAALREFYAGLAVQLDAALGATAWSLMLRGHPLAIQLTAALDAEAVRAAWARVESTGGNTSPLRSRIMSAVPAVIAELQASSLGKQLNAAYRNLSRMGFRGADKETGRPADIDDDEIFEGLVAGAEPLMRVAALVNLVREWLDSEVEPPMFPIDLGRFHSRLREMYGVELAAHGSSAGAGTAPAPADSLSAPSAG